MEVSFNTLKKWVSVFRKVASRRLLYVVSTAALFATSLVSDVGRGEVKTRFHVRRTTLAATI